MKTLLSLICLVVRVVAANDVYHEGKLLKKGDTVPIEDCDCFVFRDGADADGETYLILRHNLSNRNYRVGSAKDLCLLGDSFGSGGNSNHLNFSEASGRYIDDGTRIRIDRSTIGAVNSNLIITPDIVTPDLPAASAAGPSS